MSVVAINPLDLRVCGKRPMIGRVWPRPMRGRLCQLAAKWVKETGVGGQVCLVGVGR